MVPKALRFAAASCLLAVAACAPSRPAATAHGTTESARDDDDDAANAGPSSEPGAVATAAADQPTGRADEEASDEDDDADGPADDLDVEPPQGNTITPPHPLADVSDAELERRLVTKPASLGSMSIGKPNAGLLFNAEQMPAGDAWTVVVGGEAYGTEETITDLETAIHAVTAQFPDSPKLAIGDISARSGGYLSPHLSHQAGRDADVGYYYLDGASWYRRATAQNLDTTRTWALVRALVAHTDVEMILIDHSVQALLRTEAERLGEDPEWLDGLFKGKGALPPMIRHAPGHATHLHVRFFCPIAQETGRRAYSALLRHELIHVGPSYAVHVAKKGETLVALAKRYKTTVLAIRRANGLKSNVIQAKKSYRIPERGKAPPSLSRGPVAIPPRRLPPPVGPGRSASQ
ncbi:MAG TPA: penicillin-insensitive murein endopeptidase [Polyangiaceae bacterium]|jgi:penicillin-insensitive murein endopeptidase|nr:penicillin-insensitive murein endopeptidase [Polyangiaceae bacterium]